MNRSHVLGIGAGAAAAVSWGSATVLSKDLLQAFDPVSLLLVQLATSVAMLWAVVICTVPRDRVKTSSLRGVVAYAWLGALEPALAYLLTLSGLVGASAGGATLVQATESIMIVAVTAVLSRRLPSIHFLGLSLVALMALHFALVVDDDAAVGGKYSAGIALLVAGTLSAAFYVVLSGKVAQRAPALRIVAWQHSVALALVLATAIVLQLRSGGAHDAPIAAFVRGFAENGRGLALCAVSGLLQFALPFSLYMLALQRLSANCAGAMLLLTPLVGLLEAHAFLGEQLSVRQWTGSVVALIAVAGLGVINSQPRQLGTPSPVSP